VNILFVAAEVAPYVSVGGLSQVMYFLPQALRELGHDVRIFTAKYGAMDETAPNGKTWKFHTEVNKLAVPIDDSDPDCKSIICNVKSILNEDGQPITYFLENREYYELRANVFGYRDDHIRFALLSKGCLEWLKHNKEIGDQEQWWPDIIHIHDWHTGYFADLARKNSKYTAILEKTPIVMTVHNFSFQGNYDFRFGPREEFDDGQSQLAPLNTSKMQSQNALKRGMLYSDAINTVSQTHAVEVLTPEYAEGLDTTLHQVREKFTGILNGLDTQEFNPSTDKRIKKTFNANSFIKAREENKKELQRTFNLSLDTNRPLFAIAGRLAKQKGWDLIVEVLPHLLAQRPDVQVVALGSGDDRYRLELSVLQKNFPGQIGLHLRPDFRLPRKIYAGADCVIIPSLFEPGGIVALEALRYGAVPLVRRTGGLNDIIKDFDPNTKTGNGFSFKNIDAWALYGSIFEVLSIYKHQRLWKTLVKNCLECDFSWEHAAEEYDHWYRKVIKERKATATRKPVLYETPLNELN
jgi:starch synthase